MLTHTLEIRVRYQETDGQGIVHHANYLTWLEQGRVELLRSAGHSYKRAGRAGRIAGRCRGESEVLFAGPV